MKNSIQLLATLICLALGAASTQAASTKYWDSNGTTAGAGATPTGTWGTDAFWSTDSTGASATAAWTAGDTAVFSAGTDAVNAFTVTISGPPSAGGITVEEGTVTLTSASVAGTPAVTLAGGSLTLNIDNSTLPSSSITFNGTGIFSQNNPGAGSYGTLTFSAGNGELRNIGGTAGAKTMIFSSLSRPIGGSALFTSAALGTSGTPGADKISFTTSPGTGLIVGGFVGTTAGSGASFAFYDSAGFVRVPVYGSDANWTASSAAGTWGAAGAGINIDCTTTKTGQANTVPDSLRISGSTATITMGTGSQANRYIDMRAKGCLLKSGGTTATIQQLSTQIANILGPDGGDLVVRCDQASDTLILILGVGKTAAFTSSDAFGLTKCGAGTLDLRRNNTYSGATAINQGTLIVGNGGSSAGANANIRSSSAIYIANGATLKFNCYNDTYSQVISGGGSLDLALNAATPNGSAALKLSGNNTYTGPTTLRTETGPGILGVGHNNALGSAFAGTTVNSGSEVDVSGGLSGVPEPITLNGTGLNSQAVGALRNILNDNTWSGPITLGSASRINSDSGTLTISTGGISIAGNSLTIGGAGAVTVSGAITGTANLTKDGIGTLTLSGGNLYTGKTIVTQGVLQIDSEARLGVASVASRPDYLQLGGGAKLKTTANFSIDDNQGTSTERGVTILATAGGGVFAPDGGTTLTVANVIAGVASDTGLTLNGAGTLTLSANNTYTGGTTISAGTLRVSGQVSPNSATGTGAVAVNAGGTLSGGGRVAGNVTVANSGTAVLYPNISGGGTLTLGGTLTFSGNSSGVKFDLSSTAGPANDTVVLENKTLNCGGVQIAINCGATLDQTTDYVLFDAGGNNISGSFNPLPTWAGTTPANSGNYSITTDSRYVKLHYAAASPPTKLAFSSIPPGTVTSGLAFSVTVTSVDGTDTLQAVTEDTTVTLSLASGSGSLMGTFTGTILSGANNVIISTPKYLGSGGATLTATATAGMTLTAGTSGTINFTQNLDWDAGDGNWTDANAWYNINAAASSTFGTGDSVVLEDTHGTAGDRTITVSSTVLPGSVTVNAVKNYTISGSGAIAGSAGLTKQNSGTLTLSAPNTYTGPTALNGGVVNVGVDDGSGNGPLGNGGIISFGGGTLQHSTANQKDYSARFSGAVSQAYKVDTAGQSVAWGTALSSSGGTLTKSGLGTLTLSVANTYTGDTRIGNGTLTLGHSSALAGSTLDLNSGDSGSLSFDSLTAATLGGLKGSRNLVLENASSAGVILAVGNNNADNTYLGVLSGAGGLTKMGAGIFWFGDATTASSTYSGNTTISQGTLVVRKAEILPTTDLTVDGILLYQNSVNLTVAGLSGSGTNMAAVGSGYDPQLTIGANNGSGTFGGKFLRDNSLTSHTFTLTKTGTGTIRLNGTLDAGPTPFNINDGKVIAGWPQALSSGVCNVNNDAVVELAGQTMDATMKLNLNNNATLSATGGASTYSRSAGGWPEIGGDATITFSTGTSGDTLTIGSAVTGGNANSSVTVAGPGTVILSSGSDTGYAGKWKLTGGTLRLSNIASLGAIGSKAIELAGGILEGRVSAAGTYSTATTVSADSTITPNQANVGADHNYGTLSINGSTLSISPGTQITASTTETATFGATTLTGNAAFNIVNNGTRTMLAVLGAVGQSGGARSLTKQGSGTLKISGASMYTGGTTISGGTLEISGSIKGNVDITGSVLKLDNASALEATATLTLPASPAAGTVDLAFTGTQTINALYFGGVQKAAGTWNAARNSAFTGGGNLTVTTGPATTTTLNPITPNPSCSGSLSLTATVTGSSPSGEVEFFDGATSLGAAALSGGSATKSVSLSVGTHANITAKYLGDDNNNLSTSSPGSVTINAVPAISPPPANQTACSGSSAAFSVSATGGSLNYAWRKPGTGWGSGNAWQLSSGGNSGFFVANSSGNGNGSSGNINTSGKSWGMYANSGDTASAVRAFGSGMTVGQTFQMDMDNGYIDSGSVGFGLRNASGENVWEFYFVGGGSSYSINAGSVSPTPGIPFTADGLRIAFTLTSGSTYSVTITTPPGGTTYGPFTGSLLSPGGGQTITQLRLFNANAGPGSDHDAYFNSVSVGPYDDNAGNYTAWNNGDNFGNGPLANGSPISGADTANMSISPASAADEGSYDVVVWNTCGQVISSAATFTLNPAAATSAIGGSSAVAINQAGQIYSVTLTSGSSYAWTVPGDAIVTAGASGPNNNQITVNFGSSGGNVTVTETTSDGCVGTAVSLAVAVGGNHAPVAQNKTQGTTKNTPTTFANVKLLAGATDADPADVLAVTAASTTTPGATVVWSVSEVTYTPPTGFVGTDHYTYTISDNGTPVGTAVGTVTVTVTSGDDVSPNIVEVWQDAGYFHVKFAGIPDFYYQIQTADMAGGPPYAWTDSGSPIQAGTNGMFEFADPISGSGRVYRTSTGSPTP